MSDTDAAVLDDTEGTNGGSTRVADGRAPNTAAQARVLRLGRLLMIIVAAALAAVVAILVVRQNHDEHRASERDRSIAAARQAATAMTSIGWQHAEENVATILAGAAGTYRDDFAARSGPLVDVITNTHATSTGTVVEAAIESSTATTTQVLVTVRVNTTDQYMPQPEERSWRMRMTVQPDGNAVKLVGLYAMPRAIAVPNLGRMLRPPPTGSRLWRFLDLFSGTNLRLYRASGGRIGGRMGRAPVLLLEHVGRRSGTRRVTPILFLADGDRLVIVGSKAGAARDPAWVANLEANPSTTVEVARRRVPVRARRATEVERRARPMEFPDADHHIIVVGGRDCGRVMIDRNPERILVVDIALLPEARSRCVGTQILRTLAEEAEVQAAPPLERPVTRPTVAAQAAN